MTRTTATWTMGVAVTALLALPVTGWGQTTAPQPPAAQPPPGPSAAPTEAHQERLAREHLHEAYAELAALRADSLTTAAQARVADLKRHLSALQRAVAEKAGAGTDAPAPPRAALVVIESILTELLGRDGAGAGPVGTSGAPAAAMVDDRTKATLQKVRTHFTAYAGTLGSTSSSASDPRPPASSAAATPTSESATPTTSPTDPTPTPTGRTPTAEPYTPASPARSVGAGEPAGGQTGSAAFDAERLKLHLTAAREALAQMTRLPAAAEITGESRTQVSQLISDFNEMIATDAGWRASLKKVKANLQTILAEPGQPRPADAPAADPDVVGTSGERNLDAEIRAKLVEFRTHLRAFEEAATTGNRAVGTASTTEAEPMNSPSTPESKDAAAREPAADAATIADDRRAAAADDPQHRMPGASGATTYAGPPTDQDAAADGSARAVDAAPAHQDALRHVQAIEAILARAGASDRSAGAAAPEPVGTSGTTSPGTAPVLDARQVAEIRAHLRELRELLAETKR